MNRKQLRTRCASCDAMCLPTEISDVPDDNMMLCRECGQRLLGLETSEAGDGSFVFVRPPQSHFREKETS